MVFKEICNDHSQKCLIIVGNLLEREDRIALSLNDLQSFVLLLYDSLILKVIIAFYKKY